VHPVVYAYRESLRAFLSAEEQTQLDALDWSHTTGGDWQRLRYMAADRAVRRFLPRMLESTEDPILAQHAARLRALPPLLDRDTDAVAQMAVVEAMVAYDRHGRGQRPAPPIVISRDEAPPPRRETMHEPAEPGDEEPLMPPPTSGTRLDAEGEGDLAEALAEYAVEYARTRGVSSLRGAVAAASAADAMDVAFLVRRVLEVSPDRSEVIGDALELAESLCDAARRREHLPRPQPRERRDPDE
jgi:hypothetical protein